MCSNGRWPEMKIRLIEISLLPCMIGRKEHLACQNLSIWSDLQSLLKFNLKILIHITHSNTEDSVTESAVLSSLMHQSTSTSGNCTEAKRTRQEKVFLQQEENYWQKTFLDVDFPLNKFQNDVLKDRKSIFVPLSIGTFQGFHFLARGGMRRARRGGESRYRCVCLFPWRWWVAVRTCFVLKAMKTCWRSRRAVPPSPSTENYFPFHLISSSSYFLPRSNEFRMLFDNHGISLLCLQLILSMARVFVSKATFLVFPSLEAFDDSFQIHKTFAIYLLCIVTSWKWEKSPRKKEIEYTRELAVHEHILSN